jgi:hypothetical protein
VDQEDSLDLVETPGHVDLQAVSVQGLLDLVDLLGLLDSQAVPVPASLARQVLDILDQLGWLDILDQLVAVAVAVAPLAR